MAAQSLPDIILIDTRVGEGCTAYCTCGLQCPVGCVPAIREVVDTSAATIFNSVHMVCFRASSRCPWNWVGRALLSSGRMPTWTKLWRLLTLHSFSTMCVEYSRLGQHLAATSLHQAVISVVTVFCLALQKYPTKEDA